MKNDKFKKARGGWSRMLDIRCEKCDEHLCNYQKDGPGTLKRMYIERMDPCYFDEKDLACAACGQILGTKIIYKIEKRLAYRLFVGSVAKQIIKSSSR
jgi:hypothetical protein